MAAPPRSSASWERVLAAVEADAARAAALLVSDDASAAAGIEYDGHDAAPAPSASANDAGSVPATWRLPVTATGVGAGGPGRSGVSAARAVAGYAAATGSAAASPAVPGAVPRQGTPAVAAASIQRNPAASVAADPAAAPAASSAELDLGQLPDPADMPPMTPEQQERFAALHTRITELQGQLAAAMAEAEAVLASPPVRRPEPQPRPELVDRRL
jgi:hypothetical protein